MATIYVDETSGSDDTGKGARDEPYQSFGQALFNHPTASYVILKGPTAQYDEPLKRVKKMAGGIEKQKELAERDTEEEKEKREKLVDENKKIILEEDVSLPRSTETTPLQSFMPSPTLSQTDHVLQQDFQLLTLDPDRPLYPHRQQLQMFRDALSLPREGAGPFIPQHMYKPHTTSDRKRYVEDVMLEHPIFFCVDHSTQFGISLNDALHSRVKNLVDREQVVFEGRGPSVSIRLEWPGYRQWSRQIPTKDFRSPPGPITIAKLAKNVAKCVQRFMEVRKSLPMEDGSDDRWRIGDGPGDIKLEDLLLVSIHHVSLGSWQPHLRLRRPQSNIPIQSSSISPSANNVLFSYNVEFHE